MERQAERGAGGAGRAGGAVRDGARLVRLHALHELLPAGPQLRPRVWGRARECVHQSQSKSYSNLSSLSTVGMLCVYLTAPSCQNTRTAMHMHAALSLHARPPGVRRLSQARLGTRKLATAPNSWRPSSALWRSGRAKVLASWHLSRSGRGRALHSIRCITFDSKTSRRP